jgi:hypothetical protein
MTLLRIAAVAGAALYAAGCVLVPARPASTSTQISTVGEFDTALSPYGEWIVVRGQGRGWRPYVRVVGADFVPYATGGYWLNTDLGWTFETSWSWGWAPFHYGRWFFDQDAGWVWVPDTVWGPAWVEWRYGGGYVGWAPLPPPHVSVVVREYEPRWFFVETRYFVTTDVRAYVLPSANARVVFSVTTPVGREVEESGRRWYAGPEAERISVEVGRPVPTARVRPPRPGRFERAEVVSVDERRPSMPSPVPANESPRARPAAPDARPAEPFARPAVEPDRDRVEHARPTPSRAEPEPDRDRFEHARPAPARAEPEPDRDRFEHARPTPARAEPETEEEEGKRTHPGRGAAPAKQKGKPGKARPVGEPR